jgi:hypothetical protein
VGAVPLKLFSGNTAFTSKAGLEIWMSQTRMTDGPSYIDDFTAWNVRMSGIDLRYVGQMTIRNGLLLGDLQTFRGFGVGANQETGNIVMENLRIEGFEKGIIAPPRRTNVIDGGTFNNVMNIFITGANDTVRSLDITGQLTFKTAMPAQLSFRPQYSLYADGKVNFAHRSLEAVVAPDRIRLSTSHLTLATLWFPEQSPSYIPFPAATSAGYVPDAMLDLTNQELLEQFGVSLGGGFPPLNSMSVPGAYALFHITPR